MFENHGIKIHTGGRGKKQKDITNALMMNYDTTKKKHRTYFQQKI